MHQNVDAVFVPYVRARLDAKTPAGGIGVEFKQEMIIVPSWTWMEGVDGACQLYGFVCLNDPAQKGDDSGNVNF